MENEVEYLHKFLTKTAAISCGVLLFAMQSVWAMPDTMGTDELSPGMSGTVYTALDHQGEIQEFNADIIGVLDNGKVSSKLIMALASGPVVESAGGVLQGMSGSPVYVNGRLIGALSAGFKNLDPYKFFITPIDDMLELWKMPDSKNLTRLQTVDIKKAAEQREKVKAELAKKEEKQQKNEAEKKPEATASQETVKAEDKADVKADKKTEDKAEAKADEKAGDKAEAKADEKAGDKTEVKADKDKKETGTAEEPAAAAAENDKAAADKGTVHDTKADPAVKPEKTEPRESFYFSGFGAAGRSFLQQKLAPLGVNVLDEGVSFGAAEDYTTDYNASLEPGGPVGVALVYGDFSFGATGTVTAVDGNRILAFGHPFLHKGNVNYFMTDANIVGTVSGQAAGMRLATAGHIIGRISQDRAAGIAGELGVFPSVVPVRVSVKDSSLARENTYSARIAYDEDFLPALTAGIAYASLDKVSDTLGESTAKVHFQIQTNAVDSGKVERSNMFYNTSDVGQVALTEITEAMNLICSNTDQESDIVDVKVDIDVNAGRQTASILSAVPDKTTVKPGETVTFKTTIKPYRRDKETLMIPFTVPRRQHEGAMHLDVHGGGLVPAVQIFLAQQAAAAGIDASADEDKTIKTSEKLKEFMDMDMNNEIVIEPAASTGMMSEEEQKQAMKAAAREAERSLQEAEEQKPVDRKAQKAAKPVKAKLASNYIIDNVVHATLQVSKKDS